MSGFAWCRFCGGVGLSEKMVCASQECMGRELTESGMLGIVFTAVAVGGGGASGGMAGGSNSPHAYGGGGSAGGVAVTTTARPHSGHVHINLDPNVSVTWPKLT